MKGKRRRGGEPDGVNVLLRLAAVCVAALIIQPALRAQNKAAPSLDILENGLRVIVVERSSAPLAAIDLRVKAGSAAETEETNGVAHVIEHMLFKGTTTRKPGEIDAAIEGVGGELSAQTSRDWARYSTVVKASAFPGALDVLADFIRNPSFRDEDLDRERRVILDEMAQIGDDRTRAPFFALDTVAYPAGHPYQRPLFGSFENVRRFSASDLRAFWSARYVPSNMTLVVVGDVKRSDVVSAARKAFSGATAALAPPAAVPDPGPINGIVRAKPLQRDRAAVSVVIGFRAPKAAEIDDAVAMDVLLRILAPDGSAGRLSDALVAKDKALAVSAGFLTQRGPGVLTLSAVGARGSEQALEEGILGEVRRLREEGVTEDEVNAARRALLGQNLFDEETFAGQANSLAFYDAIDSYEFALHYAERIGKVTAIDIGRVVRRYLNPESYAVATLVPRRPAAPINLREADPR